MYITWVVLRTYLIYPIYPRNWYEMRSIFVVPQRRARSLEVLKSLFPFFLNMPRPEPPSGGTYIYAQSFALILLVPYGDEVGPVPLSKYPVEPILLLCPWAGFGDICPGIDDIREVTETCGWGCCVVRLWELWGTGAVGIITLGPWIPPMLENEPRYVWMKSFIVLRPASMGKTP